jgi:DHA1 family bicyclomycin/chloramphenicol resistance-like MFS transporter
VNSSADIAPTKKSTGWLVLLGLLTAVAPLSIDMYLPSFPDVEKALAAPHGGMELTLAYFFIGLTLGQLFYGPLSDRFGRKPPLYFGFALYTLASIGCALSVNVTMLWICRFLQGLGGCAGIVIPTAIVRDRTGVRDSARAFSMLMLVMGLAPILAPLIGGWLLSSFGWRSIFVALAIFGSLSLTAIFISLEESHAIAHEPPLSLKNVARNYIYLLKNKSYLGYALAGGLSTAGMFAYITGSPFVLINLYGVQPRHFGWFFAANAFGLIASSQLNARALKAFAASTILRNALWVPPVAGLTLAALACSGFISLHWFMIGFFFFIASLGWINPNATAAALATHGQIAGAAAALISAMRFLLATLAGAMVGAFHNGTGQPLTVVMALCGCGAWLSHRLLVERRHQTQDGTAR